MTNVKPLRPGDPTELGRYQLLNRLGEGGMGSVYLARSPDGALVALKVIRRDMAGDPDFRRRFRSEVARVRDVPAFCTAEVFDADPDHDPPYLVVEYVDGPSLAEVVQERGPLRGANLHGLAIGVATALTGIHGAGVIHRDLKPSNVLLALGSAKVIDFGIARATDPSAVTGTATDPNQLIGTVPYMAPERLEPSGSRTVTAAADVFAWGAVVAYAATGRPPFGGGGIESAARILTQPPDLEGLDGMLRELVEWALAKDPADRPTARQLLDRLVTHGARNSTEQLVEAGSRQAVVSVPAVADTTRLARQGGEATAPARPRRRRVLVPVLAGVVVLLLAVAIGQFTGRLGPLLRVGAEPSSVPSPSPSPSLPPSLPPSPSPSPVISASSAPQGVLLAGDPLTKSGPFWFDRDETEVHKAKCTLAGALVVTQTRTGTYRCPSYPDAVSDFRAEVDVTLRTADACGGMWLRFDGVKGYLATFCRDWYQLWEHNSTALNLIRTVQLPGPAALNTRLRVAVEMRGETIRFFQDGRELASLSNATFARGRMVLGISVPSRAAALPAYEVAFNDVKLFELKPV